jgi:hypothetical protein
MRWYSPASDPKAPSEAPTSQVRGDIYDWALGRRPSGEPQESPHVRIEQPQRPLDVSEVARLIRGEDR